LSADQLAELVNARIGDAEVGAGALRGALDEAQSREDGQVFRHIGLAARGKTLLYTTHYMEEAERLCDRVLIMDHGKVLADDANAVLKAAHGNLEQAFLHLTGRDLRDEKAGAAA
jgi:ABC-type multidrug transport system ATPase subunit